MENYINCIAHNSSEGNLLIGKTHTALFDCGMAFCATETISGIKKALKKKTLDYVFITHTHYDHIGSYPFIKTEWPGVKLVTCETGAAVLLKETPRKVIRKLSAEAAAMYGKNIAAEYDENYFKADVIVKEGDVITLGGASVEVVETPGHTRDALSFFIQEPALLINCETSGVLLPDGSIYPCFLSSYSNTVETIKKCAKINFKHISFPHRSIVGGETASVYFERALAENERCKNFISGMILNGMSNDNMLAELKKKYYSKTLAGFQPLEAFLANAAAMIKSSGM
ncbi:MAG: MBL fold metallo-hydrolase [Defluviitaleaceae bacterium]|nr:MBL fold metallo-hydrolase [Defluviitaleaceae bacterium]